MRLRLLQILRDLRTTRGVASRQAQFQLANRLGIPKPLSGNFVVFPSQRKAAVWSAAPSAQDVIECV